MKRTLFIVSFFSIFFLQSSISKAQGRFDATLFAGLNMGQVDGDGAGNYNHPGLHAGIGTSFSLSKDLHSPWRMVVELAFTNKGSHIEEFDRILSASYIELPIMISYNTMEERLRLAVGVAPSVLIDSEVTNFGAEDVPSQENFTAVDWLPLTFCARYRFGSHLGIEVRFQYSALSITKENGSGTYFLFRSNKGAFHNIVSAGLTYTF